MFQNQCDLNHSAPDWYVDSVASTHMTNSTSNLDSSSSYIGKDQVVFGNGNVSNIPHISKSSISKYLTLLDILIVPHLTKNLLSIIKLTNDSPVDILFSNKFLSIHNHNTKEVIAKGRVEVGLYLLEQGNKAFIASLRNKSTHASFEIWHNGIGHVAFDIVYLLQNLGCLSLTSVLPKPDICSSCQISKSKCFPFDENYKRDTHVLDLIHCDLWGRTPIPSTDGYRYYVIFVDDYSRFTWFYPLKVKYDFTQILTNFLTFVQTQFSCKLKTFQSDGCIEFINQKSQQTFLTNGIHHRILCPYIPQQNGRAERKHRHITETNLAFLFIAHTPASFWVDAFTSAIYIINRLPAKIIDHKSPL